MRQLLRSFKALSDDTRLRILNVLVERECCVCEVMQALDISQSRASRNLGLLYDAGFLKSRRDGVWTVYSIDNDSMRRYLPQLVQMVRNELKNNKEVASDMERLKTAERVGPGCAGACEN
ncbi:MAG: metalloregulator ArsR/SmtB family transcription factor [Dehalococcoidia bacterium]